MKVVYEGRIFRMQRAGGINRYFAEIITRLPKEWEPIIFGASELGTNAPQRENLKICDGPYFRPRRISTKLRQLRWRFNFLRTASLLHPTYYEMVEGPNFKQLRCPVVITVYDMIYANYAHILEGAEEVLRTQRAAILRADHLICISQETERDLLNRIPEVAGRTSVIYLASSFARDPSAPVAGTDGNYFLHVGARGAYKNFRFLLAAFAAAAQSMKQLRLRIAGAPLTEAERWHLHFLGIAHLIDVHVYPDERALRELYRTSVALLYPSRHEGFGIPPLEAMACGTVAVTANTTSLPEVVGNGGITLDPTDEAQWTDCILGLARGTINRRELIARGFAQTDRFSWEKTAAQHVELYKSLAA
jgi:glycosyltransferase involved in cell wall biosynthesis